MRITRLMISVTLLAACGKFEHHKVRPTPVALGDELLPLPTEILPQYTVIKEELSKRGFELPLLNFALVNQVNPKDATDVGVCIPYTDRIPLIEFNTDYWEAASWYRRLYELAHEIGHCALGRKHTSDFVHHSFMNYFLYWSDYSIAYYWDEFFDELVNNRNT